MRLTPCRASVSSSAWERSPSTAISPTCSTQGSSSANPNTASPMAPAIAFPMACISWPHTTHPYGTPTPAASTAPCSPGYSCRQGNWPVWPSKNAPPKNAVAVAFAIAVAAVFAFVVVVVVVVAVAFAFVVAVTFAFAVILSAAKDPEELPLPQPLGPFYPPLPGRCLNGAQPVSAAEAISWG